MSRIPQGSGGAGALDGRGGTSLGRREGGRRGERGEGRCAWHGVGVGARTPSTAPPCGDMRGRFFLPWVGPGPPPWAVPCHRVARGPGGLRVAQRPERSDRLPAHTHDVGPPLAAAKRLSHLSWQAPNHCSSMSRGAACRAARHGPRQAPCASGGGGSSRGRGSREGHLVPDPRGYALPRPVFRLSDPGRVTCEPVTH